MILVITVNDDNVSLQRRQLAEEPAGETSSRGERDTELGHATGYAYVTRRTSP